MSVLTFVSMMGLVYVVIPIAVFAVLGLALGVAAKICVWVFNR
jgi:hypothetical protein